MFYLDEICILEYFIYDQRRVKIKPLLRGHPYGPQSGATLRVSLREKGSGRLISFHQELAWVGEGGGVGEWGLVQTPSYSNTNILYM